MRDRLWRRREDVLHVGELVVHTKCGEDWIVLSLDARQQHRDALGLQRAYRVGEDRGARRVERTDAREAQDDDANVADLGNLEQKAVGSTEEERAVETRSSW